MLNCQNCGCELPDDSLFCNKCGTQISNNDKTEDTPPIDSICCPSCGTSVKSDSLFCKKCGTFIPRETDPPVKPPSSEQVYCPDCGISMQADSVFCKMCGTSILKETAQKAPPGEQVRCPHCGAAVDTDMGRCQACGQVALSRREYEYLAKAQLAKQIKKRYGAGRLFFSILLAVLLIFALMVFLMSSYYDMDADFADFADDFLPWIFLGLLAVFPLIRLLSWLGARSRAFRKAGLTYVQYKQLLNRYDSLPKSFFDPLAATDVSPVLPVSTAVRTAPPQPEKKKLSGAAIFMISIVLLFFVFIGIINVIYPGDAVFGSFSTVFGSGSESISGRWEGSNSYSGGGMTTEMNVAIYFSGGKAYTGDSCWSNSELKSGYAQSVASYSVGGGKLTLTLNGTSKSYKYDGSHIYFGSVVLRKVS